MKKTPGKKERKEKIFNKEDNQKRVDYQQSPSHVQHGYYGFHLPAFDGFDYQGGGYHHSGYNNC